MKAKLVAMAFFWWEHRGLSGGKEHFLIMCTLSSDSTYFTMPMTIRNYPAFNS